MILADKIINERKKLGLSQEELAEKLSVSRQAVSKWESAQSVPDLKRIVEMSRLFSVSTDYLLLDEIEAYTELQNDVDTNRSLRRVSMEEANEFISAMKEQSKSVALGVLLCILCPVLLILLNGFAEGGIMGMTEELASAVGLAALFILAAIAVFLFIRNGSKTERFNYLQKEEFETEYGVSGLVKEKKAAFEPTYMRFLTLGIILCVLSPLPLIVTSIVKESVILAISMTALLLCIVAIGVYMIVRVATVKTSYQILLQEGEYNKSEKKKNNAVGAVSAVYWSAAVAIYFAWSFISGDWERTWIVWPIAGVLCAPVMIIAKHFSKTED